MDSLSLEELAVLVASVAETKGVIKIYKKMTLATVVAYIQAGKNRVVCMVGMWLV